MNKPIRVAMVQDNFLVGDIKGNADKLIQLACVARDGGADLVLFPELALVGYPPEDLLHRQNFLSLAEAELKRIKSEVSDIDIILGAPRLRDNRLFNSLIWLRAGKIVAEYHKQVLPNYSVFDEVRYFARGEEHKVVEFKGIKFGLAICEDVWEPKPMADARASGADIMLVINASPFHVGKYDDRVNVLRQRINETSMPVIYLNMVGGQDELVFDGESLVLNKTGDVLLRSPAFEPVINYIDIEGERIVTQIDSETEAVPEDETVYKALVLGVKDFVQKNGFSSVVIGLSGGVDSALTLAIAVDALGASNVRAVLMPSRYTADMSNEDAIAEADKLGVRYDVIPIEPAFEIFGEMLDEVFSDYEDDATEENIQARCRGLILMAISNKTGSMVLTTGNKSEMAVGYATLYGDMSGGFAPLKDVSKTLVYKLCRYRNTKSDVIPQRVLTRPPTAELRPDQCDQDSLPDYPVLDRILELSVEQDMPMEEIISSTGIEREIVEQVTGMVQRNEYKRRQSAPGVRITRRAFGRDRRYPITSGYGR